MWQLEHSSEHTLPDVREFVDLLNQHAAFFAAGESIIVARAPGRLDVMGGIADYSGALVLELPLGCATFVAVQLATEPTLTIRSTAAPALDATPQVSLALQDLLPPDAPLTYAAAQSLFNSDPRRKWVGYVAGALIVLHRERGLRFERGLNVLIHSNVPPGKGVSSSAALEVAAMQAVCGIYGIQLDGREMALLCQKVENYVVGAPCGVMDQMTSACGHQDTLLALLCQPAEIQEAVALPPDVEVWGIDSGIRHAVSGADYGSVRIGAFMGYRILTELAGLKTSDVVDGRVEVSDPLWHGYLANITPSQWEMLYCDRVPETLDGATFLELYGGLTDAVTQVDPNRTYAVRQATAHPIYENHRVQFFRALLRTRPLNPDHLVLLGELMYGSHTSYSACGLGSDGTDALVDLVRALGPASGLYGAKITGGGSGGTVAILAQRGSEAMIARIAATYEEATGYHSTILGNSSPGAIAFGHLRLCPA